MLPDTQRPEWEKYLDSSWELLQSSAALCSVLDSGSKCCFNDAKKPQTALKVWKNFFVYICSHMSANEPRSETKGVRVDRHGPSGDASLVWKPLPVNISTHFTFSSDCCQRYAASIMTDPSVFFRRASWISVLCSVLGSAKRSVSVASTTPRISSGSGWRSRAVSKTAVSVFKTFFVQIFSRL